VKGLACLRLRKGLGGVWSATSLGAVGRVTERAAVGRSRCFWTRTRSVTVADNGGGRAVAFARALDLGRLSTFVASPGWGKSCVRQETAGLRPTWRWQCAGSFTKDVSDEITVARSPSKATDRAGEPRRWAAPVMRLRCDHDRLAG
jgi:hypothetical protein